MKLLSIKNNNTVTVYKIDYQKEDIKKLINFIHKKYSNPSKEIIKTTFLDDTPISFGKLDNKAINIKKYKILKLKKSDNLDEIERLYFPQTNYGTMEVCYEYYSNLGHILEETFLDSDINPLLDMTDLMKYRNTVYGINSDFKFDKTIDLNDKKKMKKWDEKIDTFTSINSYNEHINNIAYNLNEPLNFYNQIELKKIKKDLPGFVNLLSLILDIEEIAMFPINSIKKGEYQILERFGIRNSKCNYFIHNTQFDGFFIDNLENAEINYSGSIIIEKLREKIIKNYDLDGWDYNLNALRSIKNNKYIKEIKYKEN